jgi:hypothetical protein
MHIAHNTTHGLAAYDREYLEWYTRTNDTTGSPFDPASFVQALRAQYPGRPQWANAFAACTRSWDRNELYTYFLSPPDQRARWNYAGGFFLEHPVMGTVTVDLIHDPKGPGGIAIGGVEWLDVVNGYRDRTGAVVTNQAGPWCS